MSFNYNFEDPTSVDTFDKLKAALKERFDELFSKGYLYKGGRDASDSESTTRRKS